MKIRTDFVTNSSSSSFITILATEQSGLRKRLELETGLDGWDIMITEIDYSEVHSGQDLEKKMYGNFCFEQEHGTWLNNIKDIHSLKSFVIKQIMEIDTYRDRYSVELVGKEEITPARKDVEKIFRIVKFQPQKSNLLADQDFYGYENSLIKITGCKKPSNEIVIPGYVSSTRVVAIGNKAFSGLSGVVSVIIPDSVLLIGDDAFANCPDLEEVRIPEGIISIGKRAFSGCPKLKTPISSSTVRDVTVSMSQVTPSSARNPHARSARLKKKSSGNQSEGVDAAAESLKLITPGISCESAIYLARSVSEPVTAIEWEGKIFVQTCCNSEKAIDKYVAAKGGEVKSSTVLKTDYLIIGDNILEVSRKLNRARELNRQGKSIQAMTESEFWTMAALTEQGKAQCGK